MRIAKMRPETMDEQREFRRLRRGDFTNDDENIPDDILARMPRENRPQKS